LLGVEVFEDVHSYLQTQSLAKYCVKSVCPNTHIPKKVCSVLSSPLFLVFSSNLAFVFILLTNRDMLSVNKISIL